MAETSSRARETEAVHVFRLGALEMDLQSGELRRNGSLVRIQPQPFKVLALLVGRRGEVVTREEIQAQIWPAGTFVDFGQSLSFCIRQIRAALGDSAAHPRFVETLPRRGYRWVGGPVEKVSPPATVHEWPPAVSADPTTGDAPTPTVSPPTEGCEPRWGTVVVAFAGAALLLGALAFAYRLGGRTRPTPGRDTIASKLVDGP
jgi:DNA-binding winged helix-turn-helix (wHTH) protein